MQHISRVMSRRSGSVQQRFVELINRFDLTGLRAWLFGKVSAQGDPLGDGSAFHSKRCPLRITPQQAEVEMAHIATFPKNHIAASPESSHSRSRRKTIGGKSSRRLGDS